MDRDRFQAETTHSRSFFILEAIRGKVQVLVALGAKRTSRCRGCGHVVTPNGRAICFPIHRHHGEKPYHEEQQVYRADGGVDDCADDAAAEMDAELGQKPTAYKSTQDTDDLWDR